MSELITDPELTPDDIRELRRRARVTKRHGTKGTSDLADAIGVTTAAVQLWIRGGGSPDEYRTARLVNEFGAPSRFDDHESVATYTYRGDNVTLGFTFIGDAGAVTDAVTNVKREVTA